MKNTMGEVGEERDEDKTRKKENPTDGEETFCVTSCHAACAWSYKTSLFHRLIFKSGGRQDMQQTQDILLCQG